MNSLSFFMVDMHPGVYPSFRKSWLEMARQRAIFKNDHEYIKCTGYKCGKIILADDAYRLKRSEYNEKTRPVCFECYLKYSKRNPGSGSYLR